MMVFSDDVVVESQMLGVQEIFCIAGPKQVVFKGAFLLGVRELQLEFFVNKVSCKKSILIEQSKTSFSDMKVVCDLFGTFSGHRNLLTQIYFKRTIGVVVH